MSLCISSVLNIGVQQCWMYQVLQLLKLLFICVVSNDNVVIMIWMGFFVNLLFLWQIASLTLMKHICEWEQIVK